MSYILNSKEPWDKKLLNVFFKLRIANTIYRHISQRSTKSIRLDFCSQCQLQCPLCSTGQGGNKKGLIGAGRLSPDNFKKVLEFNKGIKHIEISNWGEVFLNDKFSKLIEMAHQHRITLTAKNGVNFNTVSDDQLHALVKYQFKALVISIDGTTQDVYETYRVNGQLENVISNIRKLNLLKTKNNSVYPLLTMQFIDFPHNNHQIEDAKKLALELGMKFKLKSNHSPNSTKFVSQPTTPRPVSSRENFLKSVKSFDSLPCKQLFEKPQINWDGTVLGCCINKTHSFGNAFETSMVNIKKTVNYQHAMKMVSVGAPPKDDVPCSNCHYYHMLKIKGP